MDSAESKTPEQTSLLPDFEGRKPGGATVTFNGSVTLDKSAKAVHYDDEVFYLVRGTVGYVGHGRKSKVGLVREQKIEVEDIALVPELEARRLMRWLSPPGTETSTRHRQDSKTDDPGSDEA